MSKHFCCCIPVRLGVFVMSLVETIVTGGLAALFFLSARELWSGSVTVDGKEIHVSKGTEIGILVVGVVFTIFCLLSIFGFIGAITRRRGLIKSYAFLLNITFLLNLLATAYVLFLVFHTSDADLVADCQSALRNTGSQDQCTNLPGHRKVYEAIVSVILIFHLFWYFYGCIIVHRYVKQLTIEQEFAMYNRRGPSPINGPDSKGTYFPVDPVNAPLPQSGYPYMDPHHSFGFGGKHEEAYIPPNFELFVIAVLAPLALMPIVNVLTLRSLWDWHNSSLGVIYSCALAGTTTNIVKVTVGRPRPDLIDRCRPPAGSENAPQFGLVNASICTQTNQAIMSDGWKSFFSGHSSLAFAGLGFFSLYLAGKLHVFQRRGRTSIISAWIALVPILGAMLVAISRTMDYRHHWNDVVVGSLVGFAFAYYSYRHYYPRLDSPNCDKPHCPHDEPEQTEQPELPRYRSRRLALGGSSAENNERYRDEIDEDAEDEPLSGASGRPVSALSENSNVNVWQESLYENRRGGS
ncbi:acid phosphatase/Vanadium-dependent haloperoxidase [Sistotremastrum suecicum HHB10207 ss-3]|uniref:Acid phosphatase/Vanadium-dependent haloperoxidase n=1 Tax=Sistotremastrum suecicum HHB10207 ss-3 TaxID=1314776 RepID=A0A166GAB1_9AGAM|nr:acid phosphatase/Vanadium-dependent haloperoxidase [Sistotremastrum suecicum HHB10207 ss-3]